MRTVLVTAENQSKFSKYDGNALPEIGKELTVIKSKVPCVTHRKGSGLSMFFSIVTDYEFSPDTKKQIDRGNGTVERYQKLTAEGETWHLNRWAINNANYKN